MESAERIDAAACCLPLPTMLNRPDSRPGVVRAHSWLFMASVMSMSMSPANRKAKRAQILGYPKAEAEAVVEAQGLSHGLDTMCGFWSLLI